MDLACCVGILLALSFIYHFHEPPINYETCVVIKFPISFHFLESSKKSIQLKLRLFLRHSFNQNIGCPHPSKKVLLRGLLQSNAPRNLLLSSRLKKKVSLSNENSSNACQEIFSQLEHNHLIVFFLTLITCDL